MRATPRPLAVMLCAAMAACGAQTAPEVRGAPVAHDGGAIVDMRVAPVDMRVAPDMPVTRFDLGPLDLGDRVDAGPPTTCAGSSGPTSTTVCSMRVRMGDVALSSASCFVDVRPVSGEEGTLTFDCSGGGAQLAFDGGAVFLGVSVGARIDVCQGTDFDWGDGCHWESAQHVAGSRDDGFLTLTYAERPTRGTSCLPPCSASATVTLE